MPLPHDILDAALAIRPFLPDLLGADADSVEHALDDLLTQAQAGKRVEQQIADLLASHDSTQAWLDKYFVRSKAPMRFGGYPLLPASEVSPVGALLYTCPHPQCNHSWPRRTEGQQVPMCPTHHVLLVPVEASSC